MPIHTGVEADGRTYYQWGEHGAKYYYDANNTDSKNAAYEKARRQSAAAHANGYRG